MNRHLIVKLGCLAALLVGIVVAFDRVVVAGEAKALQSLRERLRGAGGKNEDTTDLKRMTWTIDGVEREAMVYIPPGAESKSDKKLPVVLVFHGHGGRMQYSVRKLGIHKEWPEAICVYPQGLPTAVPVIDPSGRLPGWQKSIGDEKDRDLKLFDAMLKTLKADYAVDEHRIYAMGHSNGGYFTYLLWAARGDQLAAVAPIAGCLSPRDYKLQKPKPVFHIAGENDKIVRFDLQERCIAKDIEINGCDARGKPVGEKCREYVSDRGTPVMTYIHPGGHEVPADAVAKIAAFFKRFPAK